jgi:hypothetical protein
MLKIADGINQSMKEGENRQKLLTIQNSFPNAGDFVVRERKRERKTSAHE